jgi:N utilization substance protein A
VGACVGIKGARVKPIIDELKGERIDLIPFSEDPSKYVASALAPAKAISITVLSLDDKQAEVTVNDDMLSLAIGKSGHNVRLAAKLTGWHIDVKSESQKRQELEQKSEKENAVLEKLEGLGEKTTALLAQAGFTNIEKLASLTVDDLTTLPGIGPKTAEKIIEAAKKAIGAV